MAYRPIKRNANPQAPGFSNFTEKRKMALLRGIAASALAGISFGSVIVATTFGIVALNAGIGLTALLAANPFIAAIMGIAIAVGVIATGAAIYSIIKAAQYHKEFKEHQFDYSKHELELFSLYEALL